jgi:hypothetical protein
MPAGTATKELPLRKNRQPAQRTTLVEVVNFSTQQKSNVFPARVEKKIYEIEDTSLGNLGGHQPSVTSSMC